jgi:hypothetical protein
MAQCKCCSRDEDLRMGYCFDCVEAESIMIDGIDMHDEPIPKQEDMSTAMSKLQYILRKFDVVKNN